MARNRGKKALYEVFSKSRKSRSVVSRLMDRLKPNPKIHESQTIIQSPVSSQVSDSMLRWPRKPRLLQFHAGRVEISMPYQLAIAIVLAVVLIGLVFYRLGQISYKNMMENPANTAKKVSKAQVPKSVKAPKFDAKRAKARELAKTQNLPPVRFTGSNRIVIQTWSDKTQLEPVKWYFTKNGIKTEIRKIGGSYYLVSANKYRNPQTAGTDGYKALQRIVEIGAGYRPPPGYATFGKKPFHDAYGMKFDD
ncbi:MAG: hypothetical protein FVQ80_07660 [Planctomycetes bacterium]|nr:hypothetical protein [Planctomycetota bacterium]